MPITIVFLGSPEFAVPSLRALASDPRFGVARVVTQPDRPAGRGRGMTAPAVKLTAEALGMPVWQPDSLRSEAAVETLAALEADLYVVAAYGEILTRRVLELPAHGALNVHPSLLPRYRGSSPVQAAILNGERQTGVSIIKLVRRLDAGPILAQERVPLDGSERAGELSQRLAQLAASMLPDVAAAWVAGQIGAREQDDEAATFTRELRKADGQIDWDAPAVAIERLVRAMHPWPGAWTTLARRRLGILQCDISQIATTHTAGSITTSGGHVLVAAGEGVLRLLEVQPEGRRPMSATDWYRGARLAPGTRFDLGAVDR